MGQVLGTLCRLTSCEVGKGVASDVKCRVCLIHREKEGGQEGKGREREKK